MAGDRVDVPENDGRLEMRVTPAAPPGSARPGLLRGQGDGFLSGLLRRHPDARGYTPGSFYWQGFSFSVICLVQAGLVMPVGIFLK